MLLLHYNQQDLKYFLALKREVEKTEEWTQKVNEIISSNKNPHFVCKILNEEKRYQELMDELKKIGL